MAVGGNGTDDGALAAALAAGLAGRLIGGGASDSVSEESTRNRWILAVGPLVVAEFGAL
mgnify:CR=1 FL=1